MAPPDMLEEEVPPEVTDPGSPGQAPPVQEQEDPEQHTSPTISFGGAFLRIRLSRFDTGTYDLNMRVDFVVRDIVPRVA